MTNFRRHLRYTLYNIFSAPLSEHYAGTAIVIASRYCCRSYYYYCYQQHYYHRYYYYCCKSTRHFIAQRWGEEQIESGWRNQYRKLCWCCSLMIIKWNNHFRLILLARIAQNDGASITKEVGRINCRLLFQRYIGDKWGIIVVRIIIGKIDCLRGALIIGSRRKKGISMPGRIAGKAAWNFIKLQRGCFRSLRNYRCSHSKAIVETDTSYFPPGSCRIRKLFENTRPPSQLYRILHLPPLIHLALGML